MSIGPKSDCPAVDIIATLESEITFGFLSFCFFYIPWVDNSLAISLTEYIITPSLISLLTAANLPLHNSDTNENNETIPSDSKDELSPPLLSSK